MKFNHGWTPVNTEEKPVGNVIGRFMIDAPLRV
jgi:hypothetical protein